MGEINYQLRRMKLVDQISKDNHLDMVILEKEDPTKEIEVEEGAKSPLSYITYVTSWVIDHLNVLIMK